jgi:hypothetical protein
MSDQFGRFAKLVVSKGNQGIDLSQMRFTFRTENNDLDQPNICWVRIYNLSDQTMSSLEEFDEIAVEAGYESNHGQVFKGTVKQYRKGRERNVDSFFEIRAADNDLGFNGGIVNQTMLPGTTPVQEMKAYADAMGLIVDDTANQILQSTGGVMINPRGKVAFGFAKSYARDLAETLNSRWFAENGRLFLVPNTGYLPGEVVQINSATGMVGVPEATESGIIIRTLLNSLIRVGGRIQVNQRDITQTSTGTGRTLTQQAANHFFPGFNDATFVANTSRDGFYRVMQAEHSGDTRGNAWYTDIVALNIDPSAKSGQQVASS